MFSGSFVSIPKVYLYNPPSKIFKTLSSDVMKGLLGSHAPSFHVTVVMVTVRNLMFVSVSQVG